MITKLCKKCLGCYEVTDGFYKYAKMADGFYNICKMCQRKVANLWAKNNPEKAFENGRFWRIINIERARKQSNRSYYKHRAKRIEESKCWHAENSQKTLEYQKRWRSKNQEKLRAHWILSNAIRYGKLIPQSCNVCGKIQVHGHHHDYDKPLDVQWLCAMHHKELHRQMECA